MKYLTTIPRSFYNIALSILLLVCVFSFSADAGMFKKLNGFDKASDTSCKVTKAMNSQVDFDFNYDGNEDDFSARNFVSTFNLVNNGYVNLFIQARFIEPLLNKYTITYPQGLFRSLLCIYRF